MSLSELLALYKKVKPWLDKLGPVFDFFKKLFGGAKSGEGGGNHTPANPAPHPEYPPKYDPLKGDAPGDRLDNV